MRGSVVVRKPDARRLSRVPHVRRSTRSSLYRATKVRDRTWRRFASFFTAEGAGHRLAKRLAFLSQLVYDYATFCIAPVRRRSKNVTRGEPNETRRIDRSTCLAFTTNYGVRASARYAARASDPGHSHEHAAACNRNSRDNFGKSAAGGCRSTGRLGVECVSEADFVRCRQPRH